MVGEALQMDTRDGARPGHRILRLHGPLKVETVSEFLKTARAETAPIVILDLSAVPFVDSAGIGSLVQIYVAFQKAQRHLALVGPNDRVVAALEVTRVHKLFPVFATLAEAENRLS